MNVNLPDAFAERLREERKRLHMNQTEFAKATGVHLNTQSRYEKGEREPDTTYLSALAKIGVDMAYLLTGEHGRDLQLERDAVIHVLNVIQGVLGFWKGPMARDFEAAMQTVYEAQKVRWTAPDEIQRADDRLRDALRKIPELFPSSRDLEQLLWKAELAQQRTGQRLKAREMADLLRRIYQDEKRLERELGASEIDTIVRQLAD